MRNVLFALVVVLLPATAVARNLEPGSLWVTGGLGGGAKMATPVGGSGGHLLLLGQAEYTFNKSFSLVAGGTFGLPGTKPIRVRAGVRYRLADLGLPISPWGQAQLSAGGLLNVIGANMGIVGVNLAAGADYFLTADISVGGHIGFDLASTLSARPAFYGTFEFLAVFSYALSVGQEVTLEEG